MAGALQRYPTAEEIRCLVQLMAPKQAHLCVAKELGWDVMQELRDNQETFVANMVECVHVEGRASAPSPGGVAPFNRSTNPRSR